MLMDVNEIREYLPHRYPFCWWTAVALDRASRSSRTRTQRERRLLPGSFPDLPVMPGVLIVEAMAQAAGILVFRTMNKKPAAGSIYYFVGADDLRFKRPVVPGDRLQLEASIVTEKRGIWKFSCRASVDGQTACEATILCADRKR
jgi:3-hydroxyacyl-[acyl-carrier-protein] dehydratase